MKSLRARLFHLGRMPAALTALAAGPDVLLSEEGVSVKFSARSVHLPGRVIGRGVRLHVGAIVLTPNRVALSIGRAAVLDAPHAEGHSPLTVQVAADGVHLHLDLAPAIPGTKGTIDITVRPTVPPGLSFPDRAVSISLVEATELARWT